VMVLTAVNPEVGNIAGVATATRIVLVVEYDGMRYHGFQLQASLSTVQGEMEKALRKLVGEKIRVMSASRTDAGVHARGQVVSFRTRSPLPTQTFIKGLNYYLPGDVAVKAAYRVGDSFNVRRRAISREYNYYIFNSLTRSPLREGFVYRVAGRLDIDAMNQACQALIGEHDFASFASSMGGSIKSTVRRVYRAEMKKDGELIVFNIVANSFLTHQVRNTVGVDEFYHVVEARSLELAGPAAPACGLCLMQVNYPHPFEEEI